MVEYAHATLNMAINDVSGELIIDWFQKWYLLRNSLSISSMISMPCNKATARGPSTRHILELLWYAPHPKFQETYGQQVCVGLRLESSLYFGYQDYWTEESRLECGEPHFQHDNPMKRTRASESS
jgi:hypothetical protein